MPDNQEDLRRRIEKNFNDFLASHDDNPALVRTISQFLQLIATTSTPSEDISLDLQQIHSSLQEIYVQNRDMYTLAILLITVTFQATKLESDRQLRELLDKLSANKSKLSKVIDDLDSIS